MDTVFDFQPTQTDATQQRAIAAILRSRITETKPISATIGETLI
jgi:hypothetical protein